MESFVNELLLDEDDEWIEVLFGKENDGERVECVEDAADADDGGEKDRVEPIAAENEPERQKRQRVTMKNELDYLRGKHEALVQQLHALKKSTNEVASEESVWAQRAKEQAQEVRKVKLENARLKRALDEQLQVVRALQRVFAKKPRKQTAAPLDLSDWKLGVLTLTDRRESLDQLLNYQYSQLETQWIRNNMYTNNAQPNTVKRAFLSGGDPVVVHFIQCSTWPAHYSVISSILWDMLRAKVKTESPFAYESECIEMFDDNTMYKRFIAYAPDNEFPPLEGLLASRRYIEDNRIVFVQKSILEDVLMPHNPDHLKDNQSCWVTLEPCGESGEHTRLCTLTCQFPPIVQNVHVEAGFISEFMLRFFSKSTDAFEKAMTMAIHDRNLH